jgi:hypothetical protein
MDYENRLAKVEILVETNRQDIERLYKAVEELRALILQRTDVLDQKIDSVRKELAVLFRWMIAMFATTFALIGGLYGKLFGLY